MPEHEKPDHQIFSLSDAASITGLTDQYILHLIKRHDMFAGELHENQYGQRTTLGFTPEQIELLQDMSRLKKFGYRQEEVAHVANNDRAYAVAGQRYCTAISAWESNPSPGSWKQVAFAMGQTPALSFTEQVVLTLTNLDCRPDVCAQSAGIPENEVAATLRKAQSKFGRFLPAMLWMSHK